VDEGDGLGGMAFWAGVGRGVLRGMAFWAGVGRGVLRRRA